MPESDRPAPDEVAGTPSARGTDDKGSDASRRLDPDAADARSGALGPGPDRPGAEAADTHEAQPRSASAEQMFAMHTPSGVRPDDAAGGEAGEATDETEASGQVTRRRRSERAKDGKDGKGSKGSFLRELPVLLLIAFVLAFLLRTFVVQVFYIPSSSMEPTLQINDRMVVEKVTYQFRDPRRGEIAVFEGNDLGAPVGGENGLQRAIRGVGQFIGIVPASARDFVKRVVGLPGDEIVIEAGQVYVNGEAIDEPYVAYPDPSDFGPITVPEGHLFFLGDNRPNSSDSRRSLGFVPIDQLVGRAAVIIWPVDHGGLLTGVEHDVADRGTVTGEESSDDADDIDGDVDEDVGADGGDDEGASPAPRELEPAF